MPLLSFMWADHQLNDVSWLRADTFSWQSGAVYTAAYQHLADDITGKTLQSETIGSTTIQFYLADDGHKICPDSEESNVAAIYTATGVAWYYIIDTVNQRFKLPRSKHNKYATTNSVVGNGKTLGFMDGNGREGCLQGYRWNSGYSNGLGLGGASSVGQVLPASFSDDRSSFGTLGVSTDATKSGLIAQQEQDTDQYKYLYFYVGQFTQTALENTAGLNTELFNGKADVSTVAHVVTEFQEPTAANNYTWYRKYADGWVEQGGYNFLSAYTTGFFVQTLPVEMADGNYQVILNFESRTQAYHAGTSLFLLSDTNTTTSFNYTARGGNGTNYKVSSSWQVSGMAAQ